MKHLPARLIFLFLLVGLRIGEVAVSAENQSILHTDRQSVRQTDLSISIVPFIHDESPNAELMARRAEWILAKKLQAGQFRISPVPTPGPQGTAMKWETVLDEGLTGDEARADYLVSGNLTRVRLNALAGWKGNRFLGMAGIPIAADLSGYLFDNRRKQEMKLKVSTITAYVPRLRIFGFNRNPFPGTPRTIDAFVHDAIYRLSTEIIATINTNRVEETAQ